MRRPTLVRAFGLAAFAATLGLTGCGRGGDDGHAEKSVTTSQSAMRIWLPAFTALGEPVPGESACRRAMQVELSLQGERLNGVMLADHGEGTCTRPVEPHRRFYELYPVANECGAQVYAGKVGGPDGAGEIRVVDHSRSDGCGKAAAGLIGIEERVVGQGVRRYAGDWHR
jgi:hypothetical protein